jgi:hypothetical protein
LLPANELQAKNEEGAMRRPAFVVLSVLVLVSLALNVFIIVQLLKVRRMATNLANQAAQDLRPLEDARIRYTVKVNETLPVSADVPFHETINVPIKTSIPISITVPIHERIQVPVDAGLLSFDLDVPIDLEVPVNLDVPIDLQVPVTISRTMSISTSVPISLAIPIDIPLADTPFGPALRQLREAVEGLR